MKVKEAIQQVMKKGMPKKLLKGVKSEDDVWFRYIKWNKSIRKEKDLKELQRKQQLENKKAIEFIETNRKNPLFNEKEQLFLKNLLFQLAYGKNLYESTKKELHILTERLNNPKNIIRDKASWKGE